MPILLGERKALHRTKQLFKSTVILTGTRLLSQAINFLLLPLYTNLLSTEEYGTIDLLSTVVMVGLPLFTCQVELGVFRFYILEKEIEKKKQIVSTGMLILTMNVVLFSTLFMVIGHKWFGLNYLIYIWLMVLVSGYNALMLQLCRSKGDNFGYGMCSTLISIMGSVLCVIMIWGFRLSIRGYLYSAIIAQMLGSCILLVRSGIYRELKWKCFDRVYASKIFRYSIPLVFNQMGSWIINFSDRIIIVAFLEVGPNGIYSAASKLSNMINGVMTMFNLAWTENIVRNLNSESNDKYVKEALEYFIIILLVCISLILGVLPYIFNILIGRNFAEAYNHVPILLLALVFSGIAAFIGSIYTACGKTTEIAITTLGAALINISVNIGFIGGIKLYAASISTLIAFVVLVIARYSYLKKFFPVRVRVKGIVLALALYIITWYGYYSKNLIYCGLLAVGAAIILGVLLKKMLRREML